MSASSATLIVNKYLELFHSCDGDIRQLGVHIPLPVFSENTLNNLCKESLNLYKVDLPVIQITQNVIAVGDLHGNIHNLFLIFQKHGLPPKTKYLFLGNFIEFGEFSLEVITVLLAFNILYPTSVFLLKGNTEANAMAIYRGLQSDLDAVYRSHETYDSFLKVFEVLPFAALISGSIFCCQPDTINNYKTFQEILKEKTRKEIYKSDNAYNHMIQTFGKVDIEALDKFIATSGVDVIVMGSCPEDRFFEIYGSAISISACSQDMACVLPVVVGSEIQPEVFETTDHLLRIKAQFYKVKDKVIVGNNKKPIIIPHISSRPQLKKIPAPNGSGSIHPTKSLLSVSSASFKI